MGKISTWKIIKHYWEKLKRPYRKTVIYHVCTVQDSLPWKYQFFQNWVTDWKQFQCRSQKVWCMCVAPDNLIVKFTWKSKGPRTAQTPFGEEERGGTWASHWTADVERGTVIRAAWHRRENRPPASVRQNTAQKQACAPVGPSLLMKAALGTSGQAFSAAVPGQLDIRKGKERNLLYHIQKSILSRLEA